MMYCEYLFPNEASKGQLNGTVKQGNDGYDMQCIYIAMGNNTMLHVCGLKLVSRDMSPKLIWDIVLNFKKHSLTLPASYRAAVDSIVRSK